MKEQTIYAGQLEASHVGKHVREPQDTRILTNFHVLHSILHDKDGLTRMFYADGAWQEVSSTTKVCVSDPPEPRTDAPFGTYQGGPVTLLECGHWQAHQVPRRSWDKKADWCNRCQVYKTRILP